MKKSAKKPQKPEVFYILCWNRKFTLLEDFVLKVLEQNGACTDAEIAEILCLNAADIPVVVEGDGLKKYVQGDASRRTLVSGFSRMEFAVLSVSGNKYRPGEWHSCNEDCRDFLRSLKQLSVKGIPALCGKKPSHRYELDPAMNMPGEIRDALTEFRP